MQRPKLVGQTITERVKEIRVYMRLGKSTLGKRLGSDYQLIHNWELGRKRPSVEKLDMLARLSGYTLDEIRKGASDADDLPDAEPEPTVAEAMLDRGGALAWIDDQDTLPDAVKARMRESLRKYPDTRWMVSQLEVMSEMLRNNASDIAAHRAGVQRAVEDEVRLLKEPPIKILKPGAKDDKAKPSRKRKR